MKRAKIYVDGYHQKLLRYTHAGHTAFLGNGHFLMDDG